MLLNNNRKIGPKNIILIIVIIVCILILGLFSLDKFGNKTKVFKEVLSLTDAKVKEVLKFYDNIPNINLSKDFNYKISVNKNNNDLININFSANNEKNNYRLYLENKISGDNIDAFIQDKKLYFKSNAFSNKIYALLFDDESECPTMVCPDNIGEDIVDTLNKYQFESLNLDYIFKDIGNSLDNKYIIKKRVIDVINNKRHLYSKYTYDMNKDAIKDLKDKLSNISNYTDYLTRFADNLFNNDTYKIDIYTYFGKVKKVTISSLKATIDILVNDVININYVSDNKKSIIKYKENYLNFEYYLNDHKLSELILTDNSTASIKKYIGETEKSYILTFNKSINTDNETGNITINYLNDIYGINYSNDGTSNISEIDVSEARNYKEISADEQNRLNNLFSELENNEALKIIMEVLSSFNS